MAICKILAAVACLSLFSLSGCLEPEPKEDPWAVFPEGWNLWIEPDEDAPEEWGLFLHVRFREDNETQRAEAHKWYYGSSYAMHNISTGMACDNGPGVDARFELYDENVEIGPPRPEDEEHLISRAYWQGIQCGLKSALVIHADGTLEHVDRETWAPLQSLPMPDSTQ